MSRVRTGHRPQDWSEPDDGVPARVVGANLGGELIVSYAAVPPPRRRGTSDEPPRPRFGDPKCGAWMPKAGERCGRTSGHRREHRTTWTLDDRKARVRGAL